MLTYETDYALLPDEVIEAIGDLRIAVVGNTDFHSIQVSFDDVATRNCKTTIHVRVNNEQ